MEDSVSETTQPELIPQLSEYDISVEDLNTAVKVLNAVATLNPSRKRKHEEDPEYDQQLDKYKQPNLRLFRKALTGCLELHKKTMFKGLEEEMHYERRKQERSLKRIKAAEQDMAKKYINSTTLRRGRIEKLNNLKEEAEEEERLKIMHAMIPDGHVETTPMMLENGDAESTTLPTLRSCYVCKVRFRELHHFYDQLCPTCSDLNWEKRHQNAPLQGKVAVVTGSRVKIGYQTCLKLLRNGCTVVATTRFPNSAANTYRQESDFSDFQDRLQVYGLDLRDITGIEAFVRFLKMKYPDGIDILINNACQTVRRPTGYYRPIIMREQELWRDSDETHQKMLQECRLYENIRRKLVLDHKNPAPRLGGDHQPEAIMEVEAHVEDTTKTLIETVTEREVEAPFESTGLTHSAAMSQMVVLPEDAGVSDDILPPGVSDINGQQLDLRKNNSWLLKMEEVSTPEIMECMMINAIAPFVLNSRLKPLMTTPNDDNRPNRFIINVSAMEGKFYRYKMPNHPHTNMAKAALNMLTRTSAEDLAKSHRIFMNSVDTGWINDENPLEKANRTAENNNFQTPIDEVDAAARILDPIFSAINSSDDDVAIEYGKFLKDYHESEW